MRVLAFLIIAVLLGGCGSPGGEKEQLTPEEEQAREKSVFWQLQEPRVQLDPVEEEEIPAVMGPTMQGED